MGSGKNSHGQISGNFRDRMAEKMERSGLWPTPSAANPNDAEEPETWIARAEGLIDKGYNANGAGMPLAIAAKLWPDAPSESSRPAPRTATAGSAGSERAVLNPSFVEALMGFPPSWTVPIDSARSETP